MNTPANGHRSGAEQGAPAQKVGRREVLTVPNIVTLGRFLLVPVFVVLAAQNNFWPAFWVLVVLTSTDWVDGFLARTLNQESEVGRWLDPLADRVAIVVITLTLVYFSGAPDWIFWAVLIPDVVLFVNAALLFRGSPLLSVSGMGKARTGFLMVALLLVLLAELQNPAEWMGGTFPLIAESLLVAAVVMHVIASVDYVVLAWTKSLRLHKAGIAPWRRREWIKPQESAVS